MILQFALPNICKIAVAVMASLLFRMNIVHVTIESLFGVKFPSTNDARGPQILVHLRTLAWCNGEYCRGVLVNPSCGLRLRWLTMVYGWGNGCMTRIEVNHRDLSRHSAGGIGL
jgi:hypothetical protein